MAITEIRIAVIGLGYVGLPLAVEFSKHFSVLGYDTDQQRISELRLNTDSTFEVDSEELISNKSLLFTNAFRILLKMRSNIDVLRPP